MKDFKLQVLVVDDEADVRMVINDLLEERGYGVTTAGSAVDAVSCLDSKKFDVVLLDVHMPGKGGDEVLRYIRSIPELSVLPVILVSASRDAELDLLDVFDFIPKPVNFAHLFRALDEIQGRKRLEEERSPSNISPEHFSDEDFHDFSWLLDTKVGLSISPRRRLEFARVISSRVRALLKPDFASYRRLLASSDGALELKKLVLLMTIGETYFFRNKAHFEALKKHVFPAIKAELIRTGQKEVRLLSCGCSTGEEAYSLAIAAKRFFPSSADWKLSVTAIDVNDRSVRQAKDGYFSDRSFRAVDEKLKSDFFLKKGDRWQVSNRIKELVNFRIFNICDLCTTIPPVWLKNMHVIFCRNVMIYFVRHRINSIIDSFHSMLVPDGKLFLGHSENRFATEPGFSPVIENEAVYFSRLPINDSSTGTPGESGTNGYNPDGEYLSFQNSPDGNVPLRPASGYYNRYDPPEERVSNLDSSSSTEVLTVEQIQHLYQTGLDCASDENYAGVTDAMERISRSDKGNPKAVILSAILLMVNGRDKPALTRIEDALKQDLGLPEAYFLRAQIRERQFRYDMAFDDYSSAVKWDSEFIMAWVNRGFVCQKRGTGKAATDCFQKALELIELQRPNRVRFSQGMDVEALRIMLKGKVN